MENEDVDKIKKLEILISEILDKSGHDVSICLVSLISLVMGRLIDLRKKRKQVTELMAKSYDSMKNEKGEKS